ncbi:hypothetical protein D3C80_2120650 [compost metagenome]
MTKHLDVQQVDVRCYTSIEGVSRGDAAGTVSTVRAGNEKIFTTSRDRIGNAEEGVVNVDA